MYTTTCEAASQWEAATQGRERSSVPSDDLDGWHGGGREGGPRGRGYMYTDS